MSCVESEFFQVTYAASDISKAIIQKPREKYFKAAIKQYPERISGIGMSPLADGKDRDSDH